MRKKLPWEDKIKDFLDRNIGRGNIDRASNLSSTFLSSNGVMGTAARAVKFISEIGVQYDWTRENKKVKDNLGMDNIHHLNSKEVFLTHQSREILSHIRVCIQFLSEGRLIKTFTEIDHNDRTKMYYYYEYRLGDNITLCIVKAICEVDGEYWLDHVFSTETSLEALNVAFREWFWKTTQGSVFFTNKGMGAREVLAPIKQNLQKNEPFVGKFGPQEVFEYWQDFAKAGISRSLLFIGGPGTGKTSTVREIASTYNLRLARLDPHVLQSLLDEDSFSTWNNLFQPQLILMDDVHGISMDSGLACVLSILEHISNTIDQGTLVIGTANKLENVDVALRRPGRFDSVFTFKSTGYEGAILDQYAQVYDCVERVKPKRDWLIKKFQNLSPAYMKEIVKNIKALSHREDLWEFIEERMGLMVDLSDENYSSEHLSNKKPKDKVGFLLDKAATWQRVDPDY